MCNYRTVLVILTAYQLMTFTLGLVCGPEMTCDEGWIMSAGAPVCYLPVNVSMNWEFASLTCESVGASLVKVEDETENCEIRNSFEKFWIGLSRNVKDVNETVWNGREVVSDEDGIWDINQPDTNRNKLTCVAAKQNHLGRWSYEDCLTKLPFVCKKKSKLKGCFQCPNGDVIPPRLICDDENDCGDNSDEVNCIGKCRHLYTGLSGNISYNSYENRKTCHWKIVGPVGSTIKLTVVKGTVLEENADFVEIISASTTLPNRLTGRILHDSVIYSARNHMLKIILNSDDSQSGVFVAHWQAEDIVQNWELTTPAVGSEIISFYSLPYKQYEWIITAKDQNVVTLQFHILNVDKVSGSYWILFDGNQPVLPRNTGDIYISRSKSVKIVLVSYSVSNQLSITYSQGCKILLSFQQYTSISSPGFQEENNFGYPNGVYCEWDIYSLYNYSASIKFTDFNLKQDSDYLTIINSTTNFHPNRGFSGDGAITNTTVFRSTGGYFRLEFISDMALTADGFQAQYSIDCKLESSLSQWTQTEPNIEEYTPFGTEIMVTCMTGYQFKQEEFSFYPSVNIKCMAGGSWNVTRFPDCQITYCGVPPAIDYGYIVSSTGVIYDETVTYRCNEGFTIDKPIIYCQANGQWEVKPKCTVSSCPALSLSSNLNYTTINGEYAKYGSVLQFFCEPGYQIVGSLRVYCTTSGWSQPSPQCKEITCPIPKLTDGYINSNSVVLFGNRATLQCNPGYKVNGTIYVTQQLTCGADGTFRDPTGEKSELLCIDMDECKLGSNTCKTNQRCVNNLGSYTCSCRHGYKPDADPNKDCININECEVNNGGCSQNCTDEIPGYFCTCQMGYELYMHDGFNNISLAKGEDGKREGDVYYINHTCVRKQCPQPVSPENSFVLSQKQLFYYGDTVEYKCNHGYKMSFSNSIRTCGPNGQWDSLVPRCEVGSCQTQFQESDRNINRVLPGSGVTINYGEESIIECSYGTKLINRTQYCGYTGSDTYGLLGDSSGCQVIDCGPPVVIPGSSFTFPVKTSFGEAFIFKCLDGFVEEGVSTLGSSIVKCEQNGRWGMGNLTCNGETCLDPGTPGGAKQVVTSYEEGKLLYFQCDRNGYMPVPPEPFLCHVDGGSIKWNSTELPICKDVTVPVFSNCPSNILYVDYMERINYNIPTATDNSGVIKKISVSPAYMKPNTVINNDTEITYYAEDYAGNIAMCLIQVKIKRRQVPTLQCASGPIAVEIWDIFFKNFIPQETLVNFVTPNFSLAISQIEPFTSLNEPPKEIRITAMDPYGTAMSCSILAFPLAFACFEEAFPTTAFSQRTCTSGRNNTLTCTVTCNTGYIFNDGKQTQKYQCEKANNSQSYQPIIWTPRSSPNDCLFYSDPAYTVEIEVIYSISGALAYQCASDHDTKLKSSEFRNALAAKLTEICSSILIVKDITVKDTVFTTFVGFTITSKLVSVIPSGNDKSKSTYCIQTIRFGLQFGSLKSYLGYNSTLNCAGTTAVANITAATFTDSGILCSSGTVEKTTDLGTKCVSCPLGTYFFNDLCVDCPEGQYQDIAGQLQCKTCVAGKSPSSDRTICIDICPEGFINDTQGQVPFCIPCPEDTYWLNATYCQTCPPRYRTFSTGAKNQSDCKAPCSKGYYSTTSHEPCEPCPLNYYQDHTGQNTCTACATNEITENTGSFDSSFCIDDSCRMVRESGNFFGTNGDEYVTKIVTSVEACERECMDDTRCKSAAFTGGVCILYSVNTVAVPYASASTLSRKVCGIDVSLRNGVCSVIGHIKVCTCNKGYKGDNCEIEDNPCDANPCFNGGTCIKTGLDTFNCSCPVDVSCRMIQESGNFLGTNGDEYVTKIVTSVAACEIECMDDTRCKSVAFTGGVCILYSVNTVAEPYAASTLSRKVCDITVLFTGDQCETDAVDSCINNTDCRSYGMCQDGLGTFVDGKIQEQSSFKCLCQQVGEFIDNRCNRKLDLCSPNPCENNGKCQSFGEIRRVCECLPGYTGENCSINIDECKIHPNGCLYGGMCNDGINAYTCTCKTGFSGDRCQIVPDICTLDPRCTNGLCYNNYDNYTAVCVCEKPYQLGSNGKCVLSDPCMGVTCINGSCMNGKCECQTGYEGSKCQHDIDDCKKGPCKNGAKCIDGYNSSQCICLQGYEGLFCEKDVDDCVDKCDNMTTVRCEDKVDDYECICMKGYTGKNCTEEIIECSSYPCRHGSECEDLHGDYKCNCTEGWTGKDCEIPVNYCQSNPCRNGGNCHNLIDGYFCNCMPGTRGETCSILPEVCRVVTPCTNSGACWDTDGTAVCNCTTNYTGNSCNLIKDSCKEDICKNGGTCKTKDLGFECICTPDYSGTTCEVYTDPCNGSSKCHNTAMCKSENDRYLCLCTEGRTLTADGCKDTYEDWDMFFDPKLGGHGAWSRTPFMLGTQELSIAFWTRFKVNNGEPEPTLLQLFSSSIANPLNFPTHGENFLKLVVLRITKDSVYMSNGTQETMIKIEDSISDGRWHHVAVTWKSVGQLYISVDGILQISSVGKSSRLPIYVQLLIGQNLNGRISRVTVWKTVLSFLDIVKASADPNHRLQGTLVQGWTNYMFSEGSERKYPSKVKQMVCDLGLEDAYCTNKYKEKPQIIRCPSDKEFLSSKRLTEIEDLLLNTDIVFNSSNHLHVWDNFPPDRYFGYGIKSYTAFAIDDYGNSAECTVRVVVKRAVSCIATAWNYKPPFYCDGMHGSICDVQCKNDTKLLSQPVPKIIKCGILGSYYTKSVCENKPYNLHVDDFVLPSCGELRQMKRRIEIKLQYRFQVGCTSSFLKSLQNDISTTFNSQLSEWTGICIFVNSVCETIAVTAICSSTQYMIADVMIKINDLSDIVSKNGVQYTPTEAFRVLVFIEHKFSFPNVGASVLVTDTVQIEELKYCEPGYAIVGQNCVQCPAGSYYDSSMDSCKFCGIGQYQNLSGQSSCRSCDGTKTTLQVGSSKSSDCVDKCLPGTYYDQGTHRCEQCPIHHYQDEEGKTYCLGCPVGKKTNGTGSNSPSDCLYESSQDGCVAGTELSPDRYCVSCPRGFYRSLAEDKCTKCPDNFTTPSSGADSHEFCHIRICYAGNFLNVTTNDCQPCPIGYYQPESLQDFCHSCDPSYSTKDEGNVNKTSCVSCMMTWTVEGGINYK